MDTCRQPQALGEVISHPKHDPPQNQLLTAGEEYWLQAIEVIETTVLRSMALEIGHDKTADQDKALIKEPLTRSYKLGRKEKTDPRLYTRDEVKITATRTTAKMTRDEVEIIA